MKTFIQKVLVVMLATFIMSLLVKGIIQVGDTTIYENDIQVLYDLDYPQSQLNNHTLRQVFETSNKVPYLITNSFLYTLTNATISLLNGVATITWNTVGTSYIFRTNASNDLVPSGNNIYIRYNTNRTAIIAYAYHNDGSFQNINSASVLGENSAVLNLTEPMARFGLLHPNTLNTTFTTTNWLVIDRTALGISSLTVAQMDYWFNIYQTLKALEV